MSEERKAILGLLAEGKITADEADQLLDALEERDDVSDGTSREGRGPGSAPAGARSLRVDLDGIADRIGKVVGEMVEAGHELPNRVRGISLTSILGSLGLGDLFGGVPVEKVFEGSLPDGVSRFRVVFSTSNGHIRVSSWDQPGYRVCVRVGVRGVDTQDQAERKVAEELRLALGRDGMGFDCADPRMLESIAVDAFVPNGPSYDVSVQTTNGSVVIEGVSATAIEASSTNGRIVLDRVKAARAEATSVNGSLSVSGDLREGRFVTTNGSITGTLYSEGGGQVSMRTTNGSVRVRLPRDARTGFEVRGETLSGSVRSSVEGASVTVERAGFGPERKIRVATVGWENAHHRMVVEARALSGSILIENGQV
ncbi:MAG: DUF4097 family beta strand repeat-containing protein [Firmicutes bacterium]|nr:DUF4097 family beta strand repeat-containing protein [Bacillota bacterium]